MKPDEAHSRTCDRETCIVCASWRREKREKAAPFLIARARRGVGDQTSLEDYE
jgi:hypothetical protein